MKRLLYESDCNIPQSKTYRQAPEKEEGVRVVSVEVEGLSKNDDERSIRRKLKDHKHIVSIKPKVDFMSGSCRGKAEVTVRLGAGEKENEVYSKLKKSGLVYRQKAKVSGRHSKYELTSKANWKDSRCETDRPSRNRNNLRQTKSSLGFNQTTNFSEFEAERDMKRRVAGIPTRPSDSR